MSFVSPVNTITFDCAGNILPAALLLADVDLNKSNELLIGTQDGELLIYKFGRNQYEVKLWRRAQGLGFITAMAVGNLVTTMNDPRSIICVVNAEGAIQLFFIRSSLQRNRVRSAGGTSNSSNRNDSKIQLHSTTGTNNDDEQQQQNIQVAFSQQLISNPKHLLIEDFNGCEKQLAIAYCDRTIRVFISMIHEDCDGRLSGRFTIKNSFNAVDQIYTIHSKRLSAKDYELIVSQPGGNLLRFNPNEENARVQMTDCCSQGSTGWTEAIPVGRFSEENVYAIVCQDRIDIYSNSCLKLLKTIPLNVKSGHLCSLRHGPTVDGAFSQLVTVLSVDADTFIVDQNENIIRFRPPLRSYNSCNTGNDSISHSPFCDQIQAFTAGYFGESQIFCFIYALAHNDKIIIVHSVDLTNKTTKNLQLVLQNKIIEASSNSIQLDDLLYPKC